MQGHVFTAADPDSTPLVVVNSEATARRVWPGTDAVGRRIRLGDATGEEATVVGVVGTARFGSTLLGTFSVVALALAAVGIYGGSPSSSAAVDERSRFAWRSVRRARVVGLIVRQGMTLVGMGLVIGLAGAYFAIEALATQLFGVTATDPLTFAVVPLLVVALVSRYLPSRAAARIDPQLALKGD